MSDVLVSGAGTSACNGTYTGSGSGQEAVYTGPSGYYIQYDGMGAWVLWDEAWNALYVDDWMGNTNPWDAASWQVYMTGESPAPTVAEVSGFSISGTVELADETPVKTVKVTATASGESNVVVYTDENGDYTLENLADETTWRVTPTKLACTFSPTYHDVTLSGANQSGKDFTATLTGHDVSGTVADAGTGYVGATITATKGSDVVTATSTTGGAYTLENLPDGAWTITCALAGYAIFWASRTITVSGADLDHVDFVALPTSVLLLHLNSDLTDSSRSGHTLSAVGNAAIDTGTKKFGAGSLVLDGTGDYLLAPADADWNLADLPFTIHAWVNLNSLTGANRILGLGYRTGALKNVGWGLGQTWGGTGNNLKVNWCQWNGSGYSDFTSDPHEVPTGGWHHLAVVREGLGTNEFKMYLDGVAIYTGTNAATFVIDDTLTVGCRQESDEQYIEFLNGHIDELVVVKGRALWTANFTPPSAETVEENWAVTGTILDGSSNPVPGVLITATASGESDVTAYTGPDGKYAIGGLTDSTTWRLTPTKTDWTFTPTYQDVEISGADETGVDFVGAESGGGEGETVTTTHALETWGADIQTGTYSVEAWGAELGSLTRSLEGWGAEAATVLRTLESYGYDTEELTRAIEAWAAEAPSITRAIEAWCAGEAVSALRTIVLWGTGGPELLRSLEAWATELVENTHALESWGATSTEGIRALEAWGTGPVEALRSLEAWGAQQLSNWYEIAAWGAGGEMTVHALEAWGQDEQDLLRSLEAWGKEEAYPLYQQEFPRPPSFWPVVSFAGLNRILCAEQYDGAFWLGAMGEDGAVLYRAEGGVVEPVPLPDGGSLGAVYGLTVHDDKLYALAGIRVWVNAPGELFGNWVLFGERPALPRGGGYWALQGEALYCFDGASWSRLYHQTGNTERFDLLGQAELYAAAAEPLAAWRQAAWRNLVTHTGPGMWVREAGAGVLGIAAHSHLAARAVAEPGLSGVLYRQEAGLVFSLPAGAVAGTVCWHLGRVWCLREADGRQYLSRAEVTGRLWQDLASWDVERAGYYWTMRSYRGQLLMYGAQMVLTPAPAGYGQGIYPVKLYPRRGRLSHSWLLLNEPEPRLIYRLSEGTPALAYLGGPEETLWIVAPIHQEHGTPRFAKGKMQGTLTDAEVLAAARAELATWGSAGWQYAGQTPHLALTHLGLELRGPHLFAVEVEYADESGDHAPRADAVEVEYTRSRFEPRLYALEVEYADGLGLHEPRADAVEVDYSDGWGEHEPRLDAVEAEYTGTVLAPRLQAVEAEYGREGLGPVGDEVALVYEPFTPEEFPVNGVRVNVSLTHMERVKYCLMRVENGQAVDDWGSYEVFPPNTNYSLRETGEEYRLVIIGTGAPIRPLVRWNPD